jgi:hypothetical protein
MCKFLGHFYLLSSFNFLTTKWYVSSSCPHNNYVTSRFNFLFGTSSGGQFGLCETFGILKILFTKAKARFIRSFFSLIFSLILYFLEGQILIYFTSFSMYSLTSISSSVLNNWNFIFLLMQNYLLWSFPHQKYRKVILQLFEFEFFSLRQRWIDKSQVLKIKANLNHMPKCDELLLVKGISFLHILK